MKDLFSWFVPNAASLLSGEVDGVLFFIFLLSLVILGTVAGLILFYLIRAWEKGGRKEASSDSLKPFHFTGLALGLFFLLGLIGIFVWGFKVFVSHQVVPRDPVEIEARVDDDGWTFGYDNGVSQKELVVPVDRPVNLHFHTEGKTQTLSVPDFRFKGEAVYGRKTTAWFQAEKTGSFPIIGTAENVKVVSLEDFEKWIQEGVAAQTQGSPAELGAKLYQQNACFTCHSVDGSPGVGPTWKGLYGTQEQLTDGTQVEVNDEYIKESILDPMAKVTKGFQPVMPPYQGMLTDEQIAAITAYIKTLKD